MPRYFFHVIDSKEYPNSVGNVLAGEAEARAEAIVVSGEMLKELGGAFWNSGEWQVRVEDEAGNYVCALTFSADRHHLHGLIAGASIIFCNTKKPRQPGS